MKKWLLVISAGLIVVATSILFTPAAGTAAGIALADGLAFASGTALLAASVSTDEEAEETRAAAEQVSADLESLTPHQLDPPLEPTNHTAAMVKSIRRAQQSSSSVVRNTGNDALRLAAGRLPPGDLAPAIEAALLTNRSLVRAAGSDALAVVVRRDPLAVLGAIEAGLGSRHSIPRSAAGEALVAAADRVDDPTPLLPLVRYALGRRHSIARNHGGAALRILARRFPEHPEVLKIAENARGSMHSLVRKAGSDALAIQTEALLGGRGVGQRLEAYNR